MLAFPAGGHLVSVCSWRNQSDANERSLRAAAGVCCVCVCLFSVRRSVPLDCASTAHPQ